MRCVSPSTSYKNETELINPRLAKKEYVVMASLYEALNNAHDGEAIALLGREFESTPKQTDAAVTALLPAISAGLKQSTATVDGLGNLFAVMGQQKDLNTLYDDAHLMAEPLGVRAPADCDH
jgi:hypothetical protein